MVQSGITQNAPTRSGPEYRKEENKSLVALIIALVTTPVLCGIGIMGSEERFELASENDNMWRDGYVSYLPEKVRFIMLIVLFIASLISVVLLIDSKAKKKWKTVITIAMVVINVLIGRAMIFD